ncbi:carboxymuconolactone decarboxylase family protein [Caulobacter soli]|uniref:carboxymuconolactone decarboxylase family protein n=1 Tax=Caulobacter soli TaxID=2708539 RepID=UPI0013ECC81C|nr:carboxymuconolactone decarboxylase family protein [Caulobacter soli]
MDGSLIDARGGWDAAALAARQAEINGRPQRIEPLANDEVGEDLQALITDILASISAYQPVEIDAYFRTVAKHPEVFRRQMEMGTTLFTGRLSPRDRELAVLRIAWLLRAPYEWGEHVVIAKRYGMTTDEVERVTQGSAAPGWSEHEAAVLSGVEELLSRQAISDETWAALAATWDEAQLIEFPIMVGQYVATALVQNALRIRLNDTNPGLGRR